MPGEPPIDVVLINPPYVRRHGGGIVPPIGLCYLAAVLSRAGAIVRVIDLAACYPDYVVADAAEPLMALAAQLATLAPSLIGIGPLVTATLASSAGVARVCRSSTDAKIVIGGPVCAVPGAATRLHGLIDCDWLVASDGEGPIVELWQGRQGQGTTRLLEPDPAPWREPDPAPWREPDPAPWREPDPAPWREPDLDVLPIPARELLEATVYASSLRRTISGASMTSAFLSRGCPYSCSFCAAPLASGKTVRRFSMPRVRQELDACAALGFDEIVFYDDCLFVRSPKEASIINVMV
jgi:anaerobic magnesium-protoporphyrin IX monomethyl ester cyclase